MVQTKEPTGQAGKQLVVSMSFTAPLPITQWVQEYMREENLGRSAVIVKALEQLRERITADQAA